MAIKKTMGRTYNVSIEKIRTALRNPYFSQCLDATFKEEAILSDGIEFRYIRKSDWSRYGRNYFVKVKKNQDGRTDVEVTTQSRKVTVLFDPNWEKEVEKIYGIINMLIEKK